MAFTGDELVAFCRMMIGRPYWYGTCVFRCTRGLLNSKTNQYPAHYGAERMEKYRADIDAREVCTDCVGLIKGFFWTNGGQGVREYLEGGSAFTNTSGANGCPDRSANQMYEWCAGRGAAYGEIRTMPETPGLLVFMDGHVGVYAGAGRVIEARGFAYGVVETKLSQRKWLRWCSMPLLRYSGGDAAALRNGMKGDDVRDMQEKLIALGYNLGRWGADGDFGLATENAVMEFQDRNGLKMTGVCDEETMSVLEKLSTGGVDKSDGAEGDGVTVPTLPPAAAGTSPFRGGEDGSAETAAPADPARVCTMVIPRLSEAEGRRVKAEYPQAYSLDGRL